MRSARYLAKPLSWREEIVNTLLYSRHRIDPETQPHYLTTMYSSTFTFAKGQYDEEFYALDNAIAEVAKSIPGYLGEEAWENPQTGLIANVYYWESMEALQALMQHPLHRQAKQRQAQWLNGYQIVISQVIGTYGDGRIAHPLAGKVVRPLQNAQSTTSTSDGQ